MTTRRLSDRFKKLFNSSAVPDSGVTHTDIDKDVSIEKYAVQYTINVRSQVQHS